MNNELKNMVGESEKILYEGKPDKKCYIFECIFNPLLPIALLWAIIDMGILARTAFAQPAVSFFIIPFMLLHMLPVWLYIGGILLTRRRYKNTYYVVTDHAIYISRGVFSKTYVTKPFAELSHIDLHRGIFDQKFGVGDIIATTDQRDSDGNIRAIRIDSISDYQKVYNIVKKLQKDIYTDVMYPNDMRPRENHGYKTKYRG